MYFVARDVYKNTEVRYAYTNLLFILRVEFPIAGLPTEFYGSCQHLIKI
jgi:hypothetical protein